jgi:hypothetical protein
VNYRSHAYLALLTAAANEAIRTGRCDSLAPNLGPLDQRSTVLFDATLGSIPLRVCMGNWRSDETRFAVAAWPTPEVDRWIEAFGANELAGDVTALGYLTRSPADRLRLSDPFEPTIFMRRDRLAVMKALPAPDDVADPLQLYPPYLSYDVAA